MNVLDTHLRNGTGYGGLVHLHQPFDLSDRDPDPYKWKSGSACNDQEPSLVCMFGFARRQPEMNLNLDVVWGILHGQWNDGKQSIRDIGYWPHEAIFVLHINMRHGMWNQVVL